MMINKHDKQEAKLGFSLIELLLVIAVIAIVAALAVPRWAGSPNLDAQLQQVLSDLRYTQQLTMSLGQRYRFNITPPNTYSITTLSGTPVANPSTGSSTVTLASGVTFSNLTNLPNNLVAFDTQGIPYTNSAATTALSSNATITLSSNGLTRSIVITPETGWMVAQ